MSRPGEGGKDEARTGRSWAILSNRTMRPMLECPTPFRPDKKHRACASGGGGTVGDKTSCWAAQLSLPWYSRWAGLTVLPTWLLAAEVLATILGLFLFGSFKYQIHKIALTYGMLLIVVSTFCSPQRVETTISNMPYVRAFLWI